MVPKLVTGNKGRFDPRGLHLISQNMAAPWEQYLNLGTDSAGFCFDDDVVRSQVGVG